MAQMARPAQQAAVGHLGHDNGALCKGEREQAVTEGAPATFTAWRHAFMMQLTFCLVPCCPFVHFREDKRKSKHVCTTSRACVQCVRKVWMLSFWCTTHMAVYFMLLLVAMHPPRSTTSTTMCWLQWAYSVRRRQRPVAWFCARRSRCQLLMCTALFLL